MKKFECDPCEFCIHIYDDSDESVGLYGYGCTAADNGADDEELFDYAKPCKHFIPRFASEHLFWQLEYEKEERFWRKQDDI